MSDARIVLTTIGSSQGAEKLASQLVERRIAACVNIVGPIHSIYRWKGKVEREEEHLLLIKTTAERASQLHAILKDLHPYDLPESIEIAIPAGSEEYLSWLRAEVSED